MKLLMRQKVFSWRDRFSIKDADGNDKYYVEGELFTWGKKLRIYDLNGVEAAFIQQKVFSLLPRFFVFINGNQVAEIIKEFSFFRPRYTIDGLGWEVSGDFFSHDYEIVENGRTVVTINKEWFTWGDFYTLEVDDQRDEILALAVVLAIDCVTDAQNDSSSAAMTP